MGRGLASRGYLWALLLDIYGRITGSGLLSTISVCVVGVDGVRGLCSCIHKWRTPEGGKGKERKTEKGVFAVQYSLFLLESYAASLFSLTYLVLSLSLVTARMRLFSISLSHVYLSVSICLLLISSFTAFLSICLRLVLLLHGSNWEFEIECCVCYFHSLDR